MRFSDVLRAMTKQHRRELRYYRAIASAKAKYERAIVAAQSRYERAMETETCIICGLTEKQHNESCTGCPGDFERK